MLVSNNNIQQFYYIYFWQGFSSFFEGLFVSVSARNIDSYGRRGNMKWYKEFALGCTVEITEAEFNKEIKDFYLEKFLDKGNWPLFVAAIYQCCGYICIGLSKTDVKTSEDIVINPSPLLLDNVDHFFDNYDKLILLKPHYGESENKKLAQNVISAFAREPRDVNKIFSELEAVSLSVRVVVDSTDGSEEEQPKPVYGKKLCDKRTEWYKSSYDEYVEISQTTVVSDKQIMTKPTEILDLKALSGHIIIVGNANELHLVLPVLRQGPSDSTVFSRQIVIVGKLEEIRSGLLAVKNDKYKENVYLFEHKTESLKESYSNLNLGCAFSINIYPGFISSGDDWLLIKEYISLQKHLNVVGSDCRINIRLVHRSHLAVLNAKAANFARSKTKAPPPPPQSGDISTPSRSNSNNSKKELSGKALRRENSSFITKIQPTNSAELSGSNKSEGGSFYDSLMDNSRIIKDNGEVARYEYPHSSTWNELFQLMRTPS